MRSPGFSRFRYGTVVSSCEYGHKTSGSRKDAEYADLLGEYHIFNKVPNPQSSRMYHAEN